MYFLFITNILRVILFYQFLSLLFISSKTLHYTSLIYLQSNMAFKSTAEVDLLPYSCYFRFLNLYLCPQISIELLVVNLRLSFKYLSSFSPIKTIQHMNLLFIIYSYYHFYWQNSYQIFIKLYLVFESNYSAFTLYFHSFQTFTLFY